MRQRVALAAAAGLCLAAISLALGSGPRASQTPLPRAPRSVAGAAAEEAESTPVLPLVRSPFEYADVRAPAAGRAALRASELDQAPVPATPPLAPVRLVGFVQRAGKSRAALVIRGEIALLDVGESAAGFTLLAADEERGVRLRDPDGGEITLAPEP